MIRILDGLSKIILPYKINIDKMKADWCIGMIFLEVFDNKELNLVSSVI
jgi:hypothetical protein